MNRKKHNISRIILGLFAMLGILMMLVKPSVSQAQEKVHMMYMKKKSRKKKRLFCLQTMYIVRLKDIPSWRHIRHS